MVLIRDQFIEKDAAVITQVFKYTMNVLHAAVAVASERRLKSQTEVGSCSNLRLPNTVIQCFDTVVWVVGPGRLPTCEKPAAATSKVSPLLTHPNLE